MEPKQTVDFETFKNAARGAALNAVDMCLGQIQVLMQQLDAANKRIAELEPKTFQTALDVNGTVTASDMVVAGAANKRIAELEPKTFQKKTFKEGI